MLDTGAAGQSVRPRFFFGLRLSEEFGLKFIPGASRMFNVFGKVLLSHASKIPTTTNSSIVQQPATTSITVLLPPEVHDAHLFLVHSDLVEECAHALFGDAGLATVLSEFRHRDVGLK